jgi:hypothetical protein
LFGVDQFSEFVRGFNPSLDQDLMLSGPMAAQLGRTEKAGSSFRAGNCSTSAENSFD